MKKQLACVVVVLGLVLGASPAGAAVTPVTGWAATNGDAGFSGGSELTNAPVTTDADAETIAGNFATTTLANDGEFLELTGMVSINRDYTNGNQFRFGIFDGDSPVVTGAGSGYVGYWVQAGNSALGDVRSANGTTTNPFSGSATTALAPGAGVASAWAADTVMHYMLRITRNGANADLSASLTDGTGAYDTTWSVTDTAASPASFTYDSVAFLLGGSLNATEARFADVNIETGVIPEPGSLLLLGLGGLALFITRRR